MTVGDRFEVPIEVMARQVGEETVILHLESGAYYGLDEVGSRIWALLVDGHTLAGICTTILDEYEAEKSQVEQDVLDLALELKERGLIRPLVAT
jgi:hypothetical protein